MHYAPLIGKLTKRTSGFLVSKVGHLGFNTEYVVCVVHMKFHLYKFRNYILWCMEKHSGHGFNLYFFVSKQIYNLSGRHLSCPNRLKFVQTTFFKTLYVHFFVYETVVYNFATKCRVPLKKSEDQMINSRGRKLMQLMTDHISLQ